jgi:hypothetical protein
MMTKTCRACGRKMALSEFVTDSHASFGVKRICKACYRYERKTYSSYPLPKKAKA